MQLLIGLVEVNDADLIDDDAVLHVDVCAASDRDAVRRLRDTIKELYREYDYVKSPEFQAMANGKSDAFRAMLAKQWNNPEKRAQQRTRFSEALTHLLADNSVYNLTPPTSHKSLDKLRSGLQSVSNPDHDGNAA